MAKGSLPCLGHHSSGLNDLSDFQIKSRHFSRLKSRALSATVRALISWPVLNPPSPRGTPTQTLSPCFLLEAAPRPTWPPPHCVPAWPALSALSGDTRAENPLLPPAPRFWPQPCAPRAPMFSHQPHVTARLPACGISSLPSQATRFGARRPSEYYLPF